MNKKAIIFALDAILAVLAVSSIITASFFYLSKSNINYGISDIYKISEDSLIVLEKSKALEKAVKRSSITDIQTYLNSLPNQICANITIYDTTDINILTTTKSGCSSSDSRTIARNAFTVNFQNYYGEMNSWYS